MIENKRRAAMMLPSRASRRVSRVAHLMPPLHGPLPPLEQEALLSVRLLHAGRSPPEPLHYLPAVLEGDTAAGPYELDGRLSPYSTT